MVKKLKAQAKNEDKQLASAVRISAQQIWRAGLGAFAKAQEEGGRVFSTLVKEGTELQKRTQKLAEDKISDVTDTVSKVADGVSKQATGSWDKLEHVFEERVVRALGAIGVPSQKDISALSKRVEQLTEAVAYLTGKKAAPKAGTKPLSKASAKPVAQKRGAKAAAQKRLAPKPPPQVQNERVAPAMPKGRPNANVNFPTAASVSQSAPKAVARKTAVKKSMVNVTKVGDTGATLPK